MKICVFFPRSLYTAWSLAEGIVSALVRMGHEAQGYHLPATDEVSPTQMMEIRERLPRPSDLAKFDLIIVSGPEHIGPWIREVYGDTWEATQTPKAGWYHESFFRDDATLDFEEINKVCRCDEHFLPAAQDANFFDQEHFGFLGHVHWLPFGVDTSLFFNDALERDYDLTFVGTIDQRRASFIGRLMKHKAPPLRTGICVQQDLDGVSMLKSAQLYRTALSRSKIVLNLPAHSQLLTPRVYEVMACGTMLAQYCLDEVAEKNQAMFTGGGECFFYRIPHLGFVAQRLRELLGEDSDTRKSIARNGCEAVRAHHRLDQRLETLIYRTNNVNSATQEAAAT